MENKGAERVAYRPCCEKNDIGNFRKRGGAAKNTADSGSSVGIFFFCPQKDGKRSSKKTRKNLSLGKKTIEMVGEGGPSSIHKIRDEE